MVKYLTREQMEALPEDELVAYILERINDLVEHYENGQLTIADKPIIDAIIDVARSLTPKPPPKMPGGTVWSRGPRAPLPPQAGTAAQVVGGRRKKR